MDKVLIVHNGPFGSLTDSYKWCETLSNYYDVQYIELSGEGRVNNPYAHVITVSPSGSRTIRGLRFIFTCIWHLLFFRGVAIVIYFPGCGILKKILPFKKIILDVRTLSVCKDNTERALANKKLEKTCRVYDYITIIQDDLRNIIHLDHEKSSVVPLGSDIISNTEKCFDSLRLLYVGTLEGRRIYDTVEGLSFFIKNHPMVKVTYDIIGDGFTDNKDTLLEFVDKMGLGDVVRVWGRIPHDQLKPYFDKCNIGVCYVPKTEWYDHQPPTKTFEYVMSGLFCLATSTSENKKLINGVNGCLHDDNAEDFCSALEDTFLRLPSLKSFEIKNSLSGYTWPEIVKNYLLPVIEKFK